MKRLLLITLLTLIPTYRVEAGPNAAPAQDHPLPCIRHYESHANYGDRTGKYQTAYQFDRRTWDSNAAAGPHTDWVGRMSVAPPDIQDSQARVLYSRRGLQPWSAKVRRYCR